MVVAPADMPLVGVRRRAWLALHLVKTAWDDCCRRRRRRGAAAMIAAMSWRMRRRRSNLQVFPRGFRHSDCLAGHSGRCGKLSDSVVMLASERAGFKFPLRYDKRQTEQYESNTRASD